MARRACEVLPRLGDETARLARLYREAGAAAQADELVDYLLNRDGEVLDKLPNTLQRFYRYAWVCARGMPVSRGGAKGLSCNGEGSL